MFQFNERIFTNAGGTSRSWSTSFLLVALFLSALLGRAGINRGETEEKVGPASVCSRNDSSSQSRADIFSRTSALPATSPNRTASSIR